MKNYNEYKKEIRILCVEDEVEAGCKLVKFLSNYFNEIFLAKNGLEALDIYRKCIITSNPIDLVISDINMPKMDGIVLLENIREFDDYLPFIYVTARLDLEVLLKLVKLDIINYIKKPLDVDELLKTINKIILNKYKSHYFNFYHKEEIIEIDKNLIWNNETKSIYLDNKLIKLTKYELILIDFLINNPNKIITLENIINKIWYDSLSNSNSLNLKNLVCRLRIKIPQLNIESIYGLGYKIKI